MLPGDVEISCTSGRLIAFAAVCHGSLVNIAMLWSFVEGPWKTHQAFAVDTPQITKEILLTYAHHISHEVSAH